ncbi:MAG: tetratricopeptide repeat protein [Pseudomonadota bacterium]
MSTIEAALTAARLGETLAGEGRWDDAATAFWQALAVAPDDPMLHNNLAFVLLQGGHADAAIGAFGRALELDPDHVAAHSGLAFARLGQGDQPGAIDAFRAVVRLDPHAVQARMALYQLLQVAQQPEEALAHQAAALEVCQLFSNPCTGTAQAASILILKAPGDLQTNIPLDLLFDRSRYGLHDLYLVEGRAPPAADQLPPYDLVFNAISESQRALPALAAAERFIAGQAKPGAQPAGAGAAAVARQRAAIVRRHRGLPVPADLAAIACRVCCTSRPRPCWRATASRSRS